MLRGPSRKLESRAPRIRVGVFAFALLTASCAGAAQARGEPPKPDASSVAQYVELVPTAGGPTAPGVDQEMRLPLSPTARRALEKVSGPVAASLTAVATSTTYGAPPRPRSGSERSARGALASVGEPSRGQFLRAIAGAMAPDGEIGLLAILAALTVGGAVFSLRGRFRG